MKKIKYKIMFPVYIMVALFLLSMVLQVLMVSNNLHQVKAMKDLYFASAMKSADLKLKVVQVQQYLTDISATRAKDGLDDGFANAEENAKNAETLIAELKELTPAKQSELNRIENSFAAYYETGKKMAAAYISDGPEGGNQMMGAFDAVAEQINDQVDQFVNEAQQEIQDNIAEIQKSIWISIILSAVFAIAALVLCGLLRLSIGKSVVHPIDEICRAARNLAQGHLDTQIEYQSTDEAGEMAENMRRTVTVFHEYINDIIYCTEQMVKGNLIVAPKADFQGDFIKIKNSLERLLSSLRETTSQINISADQVYGGAEQVSNGSRALAQGSLEQSHSVEELINAIEGISENIKANADNALQANQKADLVRIGAEESADQMNHMLQAMAEINGSSGEIGKIIKTIEDIAFQTNILALNASVEAARAGAAGKGFAVVADEVRELASKSAEASKGTAVLIERSVKAIENGSNIADQTAKSLSTVVEGVENVADIIHKISIASNEQERSILRISQEVDQISNIVQTNSTASEESAAASEELSAQAQTLKGLVVHFQSER